MALIAIIAFVGIALAAYLVRGRQSWRPALVIVASAALLVPVAASSSSSATPSHNASPSVQEAEALPSRLADQGGTVTLVGKVRNAGTCHVAVLRDSGVKVTLPKPVSCKDGSYRERVSFAPSVLNKPVVVKLGLFSGRARGLFYVVVGGNPAAPEVLEARADPWELPAKGGWTTVLGRVRFASTCHLVALDWRHGVLPSESCSKGDFSEKLWLSPNERYVVESQAFEIVATSAEGTAKGEFFARLAAAAGGVRTKAASGTATVTATPTSTPLATGALTGGTGSSSLTGGSSPATTTTTAPTTTTASTTTASTTTASTTTASTTTTTALPTTTTTGLPTTTTTGLPTTTTTTTTTGVPTTTTTGLPTTTTTASTTTTTGLPTTTTTGLPTTTTLTSTTTTINPNESVQQEDAVNWSGYVMTGSQAYSHVQGTFTVPSLASESCNSFMAEWVGIDGYSNQDLIQAGVNESATNPATGTCDAPRRFYTSVWWEILPNYEYEVPIPTWANGSFATVSAGNQVTVTIGQVGGNYCPSETSQCWRIDVIDDTTGGTFVTYQPYSGPGASAEWIVEDIDQAGNTTCTANPNPPPYLCPMPNYTPAVQFTGLGFTPNTYSGLYSLTMVQKVAVSAPSQLADNYDFSVSYVGGSQASPEGLGASLPITSHPLGSVAPKRGGVGGQPSVTKSG